jgi:hypothetical protein
MDEKIRAAAEYVRDNTGYYSGCLSDSIPTVNIDFVHAAKKVANYLLENLPRTESSGYCQVKYLSGEDASNV